MTSKEERICVKTTLERLYQIQEMMSKAAQELSDLVETTEMELDELSNEKQ